MKIRFTGEIDFSGSNVLEDIRNNPSSYILDGISQVIQDTDPQDDVAVERLKLKWKEVKPRGRPRRTSEMKFYGP